MKPTTIEKLKNRIKRKEYMRNIFVDQKKHFEEIINNIADKAKNIGIVINEDVHAKALYHYFDSHIEIFNKEIEDTQALIKELEQNN